MRISGMLALIAIVVGCGGDDGPTNGGNNDGPVASVQITGGADMVIGGPDRQLTAVLRNAQNQQLTGRTVTWSVEPDGIVSLSGTSGATITVSAEDAGTATVTATSEGESDTETIEVTGAASSATVNAGATTWSPTAVTIAAGGSVTFNNPSGVTHTLHFTTAPSGFTNDASFAPDESHEVTFNTATGSPFAFECQIHPGMNGTVTVVP